MRRGIMLCVIGLLGDLSTCPACTASDRTVAVTVTIHSGSGAAIEGLAVTCETQSGTVRGGSTDVKGVSTISIPVPDGATAVFARLQPFLEGQSFFQQQAASTKYADTTDTSHYRPWYRVDIPADATTAQVTINGTQAVRVTGHSPEDPKGRWNLYAVCHQASVQLRTDMGKSDFQVRGIEKDKPAIVAVSYGVSPSLKVIELDASQTHGDFDAGAVSVPDSEGAIVCSIRITDRQAMPRRPEVLLPAVTLISQDHTRVLTYMVDKTGHVVRTNGAQPKLAAGSYAVVPGTFGSEPGPAAVFGEIKRTGSIPASIPTVTVTAGEANSFDVIGVTARDASLALPAYP